MRLLGLELSFRVYGLYRDNWDNGKKMETTII